MSDLRKAAETAIEALNIHCSFATRDKPEAMDIGIEAIHALSQALAQPQADPVSWTKRELELIDGMIEVQIAHAERCDSISNRVMAEKQKGWDMERVELLKKIRNTSPPKSKWVGLNRKELGKAYDSDQNPLPCSVDWPLFIEVYTYIEHLVKEKYNEQQF